MIYPWQHTQWARCVQQQKLQRMPHAMLLTGDEGLGQFDFAKTLAQRILCGQDMEMPCGTCRSCHLFQQGSHPDYYCIEPVEPSRVIKIDQIRDVIDHVAQTPHLAHYQIVLIHSLDALQMKAANALLKTLEEPCGHVLFLLTCYRIGAVPATIVSRCQSLHFYVQDPTVALNWLNAALPQQNNKVLLALAQNAPLRAQHFAAIGLLTLRDRLLQKLVDCVQEGNPLSGVDLLLKQDVNDVFMLLYVLLSDVRKCQLGVATDHLVNTDCLTSLKKLAAAYTIQQLQAQLDSIIRVERALHAGVHINPQLALENVLLT